MSEMTLQGLREKAAALDAPKTETVAPPVGSQNSAAPSPTPGNPSQATGGAADGKNNAPSHGQNSPENGAKSPAIESKGAGAAPSDGSKKIAEGSAVEGASGLDAGGAMPGAEEWKPNLKFKAADQEHEIPEFARGWLTKDNEKQVHELFQKAYGLDQVKGKLAETANKYLGLQQALTGVIGLRDKDLGKFFEKVGVTKESLAKWIHQQAAVEQMSDEERAVYNKNRELEEEREGLSAALETLRSEYEASAVQARTHELDTVLSRPEVQTIAAEYNQRVGDENGFRNLVIRHARTEAVLSQGEKDLSAAEAVLEVMHLLGHKPGQQPQPVSSPAAAPAPKPAVIKAPAPAVLPKVPTGTASQTGTAIRRLSDLRERAKAASAQG